jgi:hypothetical protein
MPTTIKDLVDMENPKDTVNMIKVKVALLAALMVVHVLPTRLHVQLVSTPLKIRLLIALLASPLTKLT